MEKLQEKRGKRYISYETYSMKKIFLDERQPECMGTEFQIVASMLEEPERVD